MTQEEKSKKILLAEEKVKRAQAQLVKAKREEKAKLRKERDHHKFVIGGIVAKFFPECYEFSEWEMNRILACAFKNKDVQNMIKTVIGERTKEVQESEMNEKNSSTSARVGSV